MTAKRLFDISLSIFVLLIFAFPMLAIAVWIRAVSPGPALYWSDRVGKNNAIFRMPKFRTMRMDTPSLATHLLGDPDQYLISAGKFLRKTSLDELPQLFSIIKGYMSFVGPRPALYNQDDLIALRTRQNIHELVPGLTGWAQINGRDELPIPVKVEYDAYYYRHRSFAFDMRILFMTFSRVLKRDGVAH